MEFALKGRRPKREKDAAQLDLNTSESQQTIKDKSSE